MAMMAVKGARWQRSGCGYIACALCRLQHVIVPVVGSNEQCDPHFQTLPSRLQTRAVMDIYKMPMRGLLKRDDQKLQGSV